jgi:ferredoxin
MKKKLLLITIVAVIFIGFLYAVKVTEKPFVQKYDCVACGDCVAECPVKAIEIVHGKAVIDNEKCINCQLCVSKCTYDAIKVAK